MKITYDGMKYGKILNGFEKTDVRWQNFLKHLQKRLIEILNPFCIIPRVTVAKRTFKTEAKNLGIKKHFLRF